MSKIKNAVALSDIHLGMDIGYLYAKEPNNPKYVKNRAALLDLLKSLGPQEELILNGDVLDLSLAGHDEIIRDLKALFALISETGPYERIVYIPGNHDHHFWRELGEEVYIDGKISQGQEPPGHKIYPYCFVDERFSCIDPNLPCKIVLTYLWPKDKPMPEIAVKYPHHLAKITSSDGKEHYYLFTHGHFLEDMFKPVNYLIEPARIDELEAFNNLWLEAVDYDLGHAGRLSERVRQLVSDYNKGGKGARETIKKIRNELYKNLKEKLKLKWPKTWLLKWILCLFSNNIPLEEKKSGLFKVAINEKLKESIVDYIRKYILQRYVKGKKMEYHLRVDEDIPTPFTFVFGHTHRPVRGDAVKEAKVVIDGENYPLANTGGWLRTDGTGAANGENAGVLVIDEAGVRWETLEGKLE